MAVGRYSQEHTLSGGYLYEQWEPQLVRQLLRYLVPCNMRVILASNAPEHAARVHAAAGGADAAVDPTGGEILMSLSAWLTEITIHFH
jgi:secreted Zn-dependent insulinase-like peptidase